MSELDALIPLRTFSPNTTVSVPVTLSFFLPSYHVSSAVCCVCQCALVAAALIFLSGFMSKGLWCRSSSKAALTLDNGWLLVWIKQAEFRKFALLPLSGKIIPGGERYQLNLIELECPKRCDWRWLSFVWRMLWHF